MKTLISASLKIVQGNENNAFWKGKCHRYSASIALQTCPEGWNIVSQILHSSGSSATMVSNIFLKWFHMLRLTRHPIASSRYSPIDVAEITRADNTEQSWIFILFYGSTQL